MSSTAAGLAGGAIRERLRSNRAEEWRQEPRTEHDLTADDLEALEPYIDSHTQYGSLLEVVLLGVVFVLPALLFLRVASWTAEGLVTAAGTVASGAGVFEAVILGVQGLVMLVPLGIVGVVGYYLWARSRRQRISAEIERRLETEPRRLRDGHPLPCPRAEITDPGFRVRTGTRGA